MKDGTLNLNLRSQMSMGVERWFNSTNAKDIGTLYLIFALFSGLLGTAFSVLIRLELSGPGVQFIANNQLYNSIVTAHALLMIFFMVKKLFNPSFQFTFRNKKLLHTNNKLPNYTKVIINDPFNNRKTVVKTTKYQKGVYVWDSNGNKYVGHSINLYNRIRTYFMPSVLRRRGQKVLCHFHDHGFSNTKLTVYIMDNNATIQDILRLEQHFIDVLKPNLNVYFVASSSIKSTTKLGREKSTTIYMYDVQNSILLYVFPSKKQLYKMINIYHRILSNCLNTDTYYLNTFLFSVTKKKEYKEVKLLELDELNRLIVKQKEKIK